MTQRWGLGGRECLHRFSKKNEAFAQENKVNWVCGLTGGVLAQRV